MELIKPPTTGQIIGKMIWDNLFQVLAFLLVLVLLIFRWTELTSQIKIGAFTLMTVYALMRFGVAYHSLKFERQIKKDKEQGKKIQVLEK